MKCENCCHYNACDMFRYDTPTNVPYEKDAEKYCGNFKDSSMIVELPCKVGDVLYRVDTDECLNDYEVQSFVIDNIVICSDYIMFKYDLYGGTICYLENIISDEPYLNYYRIFVSENEAIKFRDELLKVRF